MSQKRSAIGLTPRNVLNVAANFLKWCLQRIWVLVGATVLVVAAAGIVAKYFVPPFVDLTWIADDGGLPVTSTLESEKRLPVDVEDMYRHRLRLPMRLAVRNLEPLELSGAALQLLYPRVFVQSEAQRLVAGDSTVVWSHALGTLAPGREYVPVGQVDQVLVPVDSLLLGAFTVSDQEYPEYIEYFRDTRATADSSRVTLGIGARVVVAGRARPYEVLLRAPVWVDNREWWPPRIPFRQGLASVQDSILFAHAFDGRGDTLYGGSFAAPHHGRLRFACVRHAHAHLLGYSIGGTPVRVLADTSGGWLVDVEVLRLGLSGPLVRRVYVAPRPMDVPGVPASARPPLRGEVAVGPAGFHWRLRQ